jgi:selenocysteine-specific elongation factor
MKYVVAGTAGHIDHGKTSLVRALTGVDTDRLEEEKRRGISIDLGFAHFDLPDDIRIAFIDVPGHERFIKNMLAGVGGIDLVLLIIAADESIKPQTREHFDICRMLGIRRGAVVLTKTDLVDPELLQLATAEVEEFVAGSFLEHAPVIPVSAVSGEGLARLREVLKTLALAVPKRDTSLHFRLPVDRAFVMQGFGTVVTGTVVAGSISLEDEVESQPGSRRARVRGIQTQGQSARSAHAGQRAALNLAGVDHDQLYRGLVLVKPATFAAATQVDCSFELLPDAKPLKDGSPVHFHTGSAEVEAEFRLLSGGRTLQPRSRAYARFVLADPLLILPGDRFVVRRFSPVVTIGGGEVLDIAPPRRNREASASRLKVLELGPSRRIALFVSESKYGMSTPDITRRTGLPASVLSRIEDPGLLKIAEPQPWWLNVDWMKRTSDALKEQVAEYHRHNPLSPGASKEAIRSRLFAGAPSFLSDAVLARQKEVVAEGDLLRLRTFQPSLQQDEHSAVAKIEEAFRTAGLAVPGLSDVLRACGVELTRARPLLQILLRERKLVKISDELIYHAQALVALKQLLQTRKGEKFSVADFKEWTGVSRKYAIPLLEHLDREHVTRREGDSRVVI